MTSSDREVEHRRALDRATAAVKARFGFEQIGVYVRPTGEVTPSASLDRIIQTAVAAALMDPFEAVLDEHDWEVLTAICEFYIDEANEHCHAGRSLAHRIIEVGCRG